MRFSSAFACCLTLILLSVTPTVAGSENGAVVIQNEEQALFWYGFWDGENIFVLGGSAEDALEAFLCETPLEGEILPLYNKLVLQPNGKEKYLERGSAYVRVYAPATPADFSSDPCGFLSDGPQIAEGIASWTFHDNDLTGRGRGKNVWGFTEKGALYDLSGDLCPGGIIHYQAIRRWTFDSVNPDLPDCLPDCVIPRVWKGPRLSCKAF